MAGEVTNVEDGAWTKIFTLLPPGSELKEVMLPSYDETNQLTSVLKAQMMTLLNETQIEGKTVSVEFFNSDQSSRGRIDLETAMIDKSRSLLSTKQPVIIHFENLDARGTGLYYQLESSEGVLLGPATTTIHHPPATAMNQSQSPFRAMAAVGMSLFTQSLLAAPPTPMTAAEFAAIQADASSRESVAKDKTASAEADLDKNVADSDAASKAAAAFLAKSDLPPVKSDDPSDPAAKPLEVPADGNTTVISCDGPIYFDPDERVLVYLKNVTVNDPRFTFTGANEAKAFFAKKPAKPKEEKGEKTNTPSKKDASVTKDKPGKKASDKSIPGLSDDVATDIGDLERVVATGVIKIVQKPEDDKEPIEASGAIFTYNAKSGEITISGGYPWVRQGARYLRSKKANNLLRIYPNESRFDTPGGGWDAGIPIPQKKPK